MFLDERRILKTRSGKHFICKAKLRDGTELYRHHVITAKIGMSCFKPFLCHYHAKDSIESHMIVSDGLNTSFGHCVMQSISRESPAVFNKRKERVTKKRLAAVYFNFDELRGVWKCGLLIETKTTKVKTDKQIVKNLC